MISETYNMDCMEYMRQFPDKHFELAVVDPPYGIDAASDVRGDTKYGKAATKSKSYGKKDWDNYKPNLEYFQELRRVSKNQIIWGANHFLGWKSSCWIVWDKDNSGDFADCELAYTSFSTAVRKFKFRWNGMLQQNMKDKETRIHPTQKPVALYDWIYKNYLPNGGKVLDTHLGSGSNRIAADKAGNIDFWGYELDKDYYDAQEKRWADFKKQLNLFRA